MNEYKYLKECIQKFLSWTPLPPPQVSSVKVLKVRYYGPIGTSGYAVICKDIVQSIAGVNQYVDLSFVPLSVQNFNPNDDNEGNRLLRALCPYKSVEDFYRPLNASDIVDVIILHSVPDLWIPIVKRERALNRCVTVIGVTVWETDAIPPQWIPHLRWIDRLTVPNRWNADVIVRDVPGVDVCYVPHPVLPKAVTSSGLTDIPDSVKQIDNGKNPYVFYTINEWSGRKGIELLVSAFVDEFGSDDNVVLVIKTHGEVPRAIGEKFVQRSLRTRPDPPRIILEYQRWTDDGIDALHSAGHCYVSLTHSEGHGLGACDAALRGKYVIMSDYGGQTDYLRGVGWVTCTEVPACYCIPFDLSHKQCLSLPCCKDFSYFITAQQKWGDPNLSEAKQLMRTAYSKRLSGDPRTVNYLTNHFGADATGKRFLDYVMSTVFLKEGSRVPFPRAGLPNTYDVPAESVLPLRELGVRMEDNPFSTRPRVLVISAGFLGNFGDDSYVVMHQKMLGDKYDLRFCNTVSWLDAEGRLQDVRDFRPGCDVQPFDHLVIGGGGLINRGETRSSIFAVYFPYCQEHNLPVSLVSVGLAFDAVNDETTRRLDEETWVTWAGVLEYAESISVRSHADKASICSMISSARHHRVHVCADACYGLVDHPRRRTRKSLIVYAPTTSLCLQFPDVAIQLQNELIRYPGSRVAMVEMGGMTKTCEFPNTFIAEETRRLKALFPDALVYPGRYFSGEMKALHERQNGQKVWEMDDQTPQRVLRLVERAHCVLTGRYHGVVVARALRVPCYTGTTSLYKIEQELSDNLDTSSWAKHYSVLCDAIDYCERFGRQPDPTTWSEDTRNTAIVDVCTNSTVSVPYCQNLSSQQLFFKRQEVFLSLMR